MCYNKRAQLTRESRNELRHTPDVYRFRLVFLFQNQQHSAALYRISKIRLLRVDSGVQPRALPLEEGGPQGNRVTR